MASKNESSEKEEPEKNKEKMKCGIIMPISEMPCIRKEYTRDHWANVLSAIKEAIKLADFTPCVVWDNDATNIIQAKIINNLKEIPVVICDLSGKNANVMFELGLRVSYKKPVILIKDDITDGPFDTSPIEYVSYNHEMTFTQGQKLISELSQKIKSEYQLNQAGKYKHFLSYFAEIEPADAKKEYNTVELKSFMNSTNQRILYIETQIDKIIRMTSRNRQPQHNAEPVLEQPTIFDAIENTVDITSNCSKNKPVSPLDHKISSILQDIDNLGSYIQMLPNNSQHKVELEKKLQNLISTLNFLLKEKNQRQQS